jgi:hypothetical protein
MASQTETKQISFSSISEAVEQGIAGADPARAVGLLGLHRVRAAKTKGMEREQARLSKKLGPRDPRVLALNRNIELNRGLVRDLAVELDHAGIEAPIADANTWIVHGFVRDRALKGIPKLTVAIYDGKGAWIQALGFACTDERGYFKLSFSSAKPGAGTRSVATTGATTVSATITAATCGPELFIHVLDKTGAHIFIDKGPLTLQPGNVDYREIILGDGTGTCQPPHDASAPKPGPKDPVVCSEPSEPCEPPGGDADTWVIQGRISDANGRGISNLVVSVYDKDLVFDDRLGTIRTGVNGDYRLVYRTRDFGDLMEQNPDLYLNITDRSGTVCYTTKDAIKYNAGRTETFNVTLPVGSENRWWRELLSPKTP